MSRRTAHRRKNSSPYLFMILSLVLLLALFIVGGRAMNVWTVYAAEAAVTPEPTPTVIPVSVTPDPSRATPTPTPTPKPTATPTPAAVAASSAASGSTLKAGSKGQEVTDLQTRLQQLGYYTGVIDGAFGNGTKSAVQAFQDVNGLSVDGIAGPKTLAALYDGSAKSKPDPVDVLAGDVPLLVNKWNPLPAGFEPTNLVTVKDLAGDLLIYDHDGIQAVREAAEALIRMIQAAQAEGYSPWKLREAYRTVADQQQIFNSRVRNYEKEGNTNVQAIALTRRTVADPGCSEHHTGLAFDLNVPGEAFMDTAQYVWLKRNCWDYGFILRYTDEKEDITGITGEEWHVRYVGVEHAQKMRDLDYCLEEYVEYLNQQ